MFTGKYPVREIKGVYYESIEEYTKNVDLVLYDPNQVIKNPIVKDLVDGLLKNNVEERLLKIEGLRGNPFFASINWTEIEARRSEPPIKLTNRLSNKSQ